MQPLSAAIALGIAAAICDAIIGEAWLVRGAQGIAFIFVVYSIARHLLRDGTIIGLLKWVAHPIALLYSVGWLDDVIQHLESVFGKIGNIEINLYAVVRTFLFGFVLFWFGRISNSTGQRVIRARSALDAGTR